MTHEIRLPVLSVKDGTVLTNSRNVADFFERPHFQVLRSIRDLDCSHEFMECNFVSFKINDLTGVSTSHYEMTKDGFTFLAMGFTGPKAARFKEAYIAQFNAMEEEIRRRDDEDAEIIPFTPESEARLLVGQAQRTFGPKAAQQLWGHLGLPVVPAMLLAEPQAQMTFTFGATIAANQNTLRAA